MTAVYRYTRIVLASALIGGISLHARPEKPLNAAELQLALKKLSVLGSVLYVAAHPDDENTRVLAFLSKGRLLHAGYLSITRGDGGQNLIGTEQGELLGVIRTQELLAARKIDGAEQFFTRAIDFGYSKNPEETLKIWDKEKILSDVVWVIRKFRPDVILTRFTPELGGHGHHRASAILAEEAFHAAGDSTRFPEQLQFLQPWQPKRLLWNAWRPAREEQPADLTQFLQIDVGEYNPLLGQSYAELAAESRSMHKSQGFGAVATRGTVREYFQHTAGEAAQNDLFEGINTTWSRIAGGEAVGTLLEEVYRAFQPQNPSAVLPQLLRAAHLLDSLPPHPWIAVKRAELARVIRSCAGIWLEAIAGDYSAPPGGEVKLRAMIVNRSDFPVTLEKISLPFGAPDSLLQTPLTRNQAVEIETSLHLPEDAAYSHPFWLKEKPYKGAFGIHEQQWIGLAEEPAPLRVKFTVLMGEEYLSYETPLLYRWRDPVEGEKYRRFEIVPPVTVNFEESSYIFGDAARKEIRLRIKSAKAGAEGKVRLHLPAGWHAGTTEIPFTFTKKDEEISRRIAITPPATPMSRTLTAEVILSTPQPARSIININHPHIPLKTLFPPTEASLVRIDLKKIERKIGYVMGSGDDIPRALQQIGYPVTLLSDEDLLNLNLSRYEVIITGVRAYNTREVLKQAQPRLLEFVRNGGTLIVQYNTSQELVTEEFGPYPFKLSRERISVEEAPVEFLNLDHPLLQHPNSILQRDFSGWVQERGLYFPGEWDKNYHTVLSSSDPGEKPLQGGILYARYGKGVYIYTAYSWFRQLPAGVAGAYRLFVNMICAGISQ